MGDITRDVSNDLNTMNDEELRNALNDGDFLKESIVSIILALRGKKKNTEISGSKVDSPEVAEAEAEGLTEGLTEKNTLLPCAPEELTEPELAAFEEAKCKNDTEAQELLAKLRVPKKKRSRKKGRK